MHIPYALVVPVLTAAVAGATRPPTYFAAMKQRVLGDVLASPPPPPQLDAAAATKSSGSGLTFKSKRAKDFYVDGKTLPYVDFDVGPSYAGLLPVSSKKGEKQKLFFWFFPAETKKGADDLVFWTNGGPGCSSMEGFLQENGPISWAPGQARPTRNPHSWTQSASVIWVEQPVGTGYTQGKPTAKNEVDVAAAVFGMMKQWLQVFPEMKGKKFWLTGESYAGFYVPWTASYWQAHQKSIDLPLQGVGFFDPSLTYSVIQEQVPLLPLVKRYEHSFALNSSTMAYIEELDNSCGYAAYRKKYLTYPPPAAPFPIPEPGTFDDNNFNFTCDIFDLVYEAAMRSHNGAFNIYHVVDTYPILWSELNFPYTAQLFPGEHGDPVYFNRTEVKKALHAPVDSDWAVCSSFKSKPVSVFPNGDASLPSALSVLPGVIEKSKRSLIGHGLTDMVLISGGTRLAIQNMTWGGNQGFRTPVNSPLVVDGLGDFGHWTEERGLTYVEVDLSGHQIPQYQPQAALQILEYLLGQRASLST